MILGVVTPGGNTEPGAGGPPASLALLVVGALLKAVGVLGAEGLLVAGAKLKAPLSIGSVSALALALALAFAFAVAPDPGFALLVGLTGLLEEGLVEGSVEVLC